MDWFEANQISVNVQKTKLICFRNPLKRQCIDIPFILHSSSCVSCTCTPIRYHNTVKYLGLFFDSDLSWNTHLDYLAKRLRGVSCLLYHTKTFLPISVRKTVVNALAYGVLRYGITIFANCSTLWRTKIDAILRNIAKNVAYNPNLNQDDDIFSYVGLPRFLPLFHRCVILRHYWLSQFKIPRTVQRSIRNSEHFIIPRVYTKYGKSVRSYYVPRIFNKLPDFLDQIDSQRVLKKRIKQLC